jgi:hypothetical protein
VDKQLGFFFDIAIQDIMGKKKCKHVTKKERKPTGLNGALHVTVMGSYATLQ